VKLHVWPEPQSLSALQPLIAGGAGGGDDAITVAVGGALGADTVAVGEAVLGGTVTVASGVALGAGGVSGAGAPEEQEALAARSAGARSACAAAERRVVRIDPAA
jgi:hypothetical protein